MPMAGYEADASRCPINESVNSQNTHHTEVAESWHFPNYRRLWLLSQNKEMVS